MRTEKIVNNIRTENLQNEFKHNKLKTKQS